MNDIYNGDNAVRENKKLIKLVLIKVKKYGKTLLQVLRNFV